MTKVKIQPDAIMVNFLRATVTDVNSSRSGSWIYPDFPLVSSLGDASYPRIGVTILTETGEPMGFNDDDQWETVNFQIDVVTKKDLIFTATTTDEAMGTIASTANSNRMTYTNIPTTVTNIKHNTTAYGTVTAKATDSVFTSPGSLSAGTVEWSQSTGNLNFSSADVSSHDGQAITSTYVIKMEGKKCVQHVARDVVKQIKNNWRSAATFAGLEYPVKIANNPVALDEDLGIYRQVLEYKCNGVNFGEDTG